MRSLTALVAFAVLALAPRDASAQTPAPVPPPRLPSASAPPPPPQPADTVQPGVTLLVPTRPAPSPAPIALGNGTSLGTASALVAAPPTDATMRCKDGAFLTGTPLATRCSDRGGVAAILPAPPSTPPAARTPDA